VSVCWSIGWLVSGRSRLERTLRVHRTHGDDKEEQQILTAIRCYASFSFSLPLLLLLPSPLHVCDVSLRVTRTVMRVNKVFLYARTLFNSKTFPISCCFDLQLKKLYKND